MVYICKTINSLKFHLESWAPFCLRLKCLNIIWAGTGLRDESRVPNLLFIIVPKYFLGGQNWSDEFHLLAECYHSYLTIYVTDGMNAKPKFEDSRGCYVMDGM